MSDEFFVGYAPTPPRTRRFALGVGIYFVVFVAVLAASWASTQRRAGTATWAIDEVVERTGVLHVAPYGMLHQVGPNGEVHTTLVVEAGKAGLAPEASELHGRAVTVRGTVLDRAGADMVALAGAPDDLTASEANPLAVPETTFGAVELTGRAVDSKCFLGAMKPGDGAGHGPCARLCLKGGIPPVLVTTDPEHPFVLLAGADGKRLDLERLWPRVGEVHRFKGQLRKVGTVEILDWEE